MEEEEGSWERAGTFDIKKGLVRIEGYSGIRANPPAGICPRPISDNTHAMLRRVQARTVGPCSRKLGEFVFLVSLAEKVRQRMCRI